MTGFLRHIAVDPADHPETIPNEDALGGMFEAGGHPSPERRLAAAVILQAVSDALAPTRGGHGLDRDAARRWLDDAGPHFALVCDLAGLHPSRVSARWRRVRDSGADLRTILPTRRWSGA